MNYGKLFRHLEKKCHFRKAKVEGGITWTCDNDLTFTKEFCKKNKLDFEKVKARLWPTGGHCDCEVIFNSMEQIEENEEMK